MEEQHSTEHTKVPGNTVFHADMKYAPREFREIACWSWASHAEPVISEAGYFGMPVLAGIGTVR